MDITRESLPVLSFCTGFRGLETALENISGDKYKPVAYVEIEAFACFNLVKQMAEHKLDAVPIWTNLKTFPAKEFHQKIYGITGGYPCQPFSNAGAKKGIKDPRHLWPFIEIAMQSILPVFGFFENVDTHLNNGFDTVYKSLSKMGYAVEIGIYTAQEIGAPHVRKRIFILAINKLGYAQHVRQIAASIGRGPGTTSSKEPKKRQSTQQPSRANKPGECSSIYPENLAHDNSNRNFDYSRKIQSSASENEIKTPERKRLRPKSEPEDSERHSWPAGYGQEQFDFEPPRHFFKSELGLLADGYDTYEDIMRLLGNGVVWQQAAFAFKDILKKHEKNLTHPLNQ